MARGKSSGEKIIKAAAGKKIGGRKKSVKVNSKKSAAKNSKNSSPKIPNGKAGKPTQKLPLWRRPFHIIFAWGGRVRRRHQNWLSRRPHRSFYLTRRRDIKRRLRISGYFKFSGEVWRLIWRNKKLFLKFFLLYAILSAVIVGALNGSTYSTLRDSLSQAGIKGLTKITALVGSAITSGSGTTDATQKIFAVILLLLGWMTLVWLLRQIKAGHKVRLRDGLYAGGSPVLATLCVLIVALVQLLPFALILLAYSALTGVGIINSGMAIENMAAWCALAVIAALTLYWLTATFLALVIVTLPGMYPFKALKAAGDLVVGRRLRLMYRLIFMVLPLVLMWLIVLIPVVILDAKIKIAWLPLVPLAVLILSTLSLIWVSSYVYILYRRIVDDGAAVPLREKRFGGKFGRRGGRKKTW
ncbi:MAG: hypothetical protein LBM73_02515 [Candidatus Nomurabacteria bacterium]|jgi:hypothetical protein|nr:hypothetical protein [Candidatus Nomurabacteria bacterium]